MLHENSGYKKSTGKETKAINIRKMKAKKGYVIITYRIAKVICRGNADMVVKSRNLRTLYSKENFMY